MLLYPRNRLIIDGLYSVQYSKRLLPHALFKSPIRQTHARYRFNEKRVFFLKSFEAEKIKEKTKKKEEEAVFWQTAEPTGIIISNRNYKEELKEVKSLNNAKRLTHVNRWSDGLKTGPDECLFFFSSLSSSTSTTHCLLKMSADLAKLEQHLATRSYVEG